MAHRPGGQQQPWTYSATARPMGGPQIYPTPQQPLQPSPYYGNGYGGKEIGGGGGIMGGGGHGNWGGYGGAGMGGGSMGTGGGRQGMGHGYDGKSIGSSVSNGGGVGIGGAVGDVEKGGRVTLAKTTREKQDYATRAEFFALIKAMDHLERAWCKDAVSSEDYEKGCWTLIQKFRSLRATADGVVPDMDRFMEEYKIQAPKGHYRLLKAGMPATVEVRGGDTRNDREQMKNAAQCTQNFITLMDSLQLNVKTVEALLPGSIALIETLDKVDTVPADFPFKEKLRKWVQKMNGMRAVDELSSEDGSEFSLDLETSYQAFHRCLEQQS